jgi:copper chaperone
MKDLNLYIEGMSCGHCLNAVRQALGEAPGVEVVSVQMGRARVSYDERLTEPSRIEAAVKNAGYPATAAPA